MITAKTVEEAIAQGAAQLGVAEEEVDIEVLVQPKKGILGIGAVAAQVRVSYTRDGAGVAFGFVRSLVESMGLDASVTMETGVGEDGDETQIRIEGEDAGALIGYHGETLDALQYLAGLAANKKEEGAGKSEYTKVVVDIENYREKREDALRGLARRMAGKVQKYHRNITLEPMSPYERRIIHSEVQKVAGVTTESIGEGDGRRVVIHLEGKTVTERDRAEAGVKESTGATGGKKRRRRRRKHSEDGVADTDKESFEENTPEMPTNPEDYFEIVDASVYLNEEE